MNDEPWHEFAVRWANHNPEKFPRGTWCSNGTECRYHKNGKCQFVHPDERTLKWYGTLYRILGATPDDVPFVPCHFGDECDRADCKFAHGCEVEWIERLKAELEEPEPAPVPKPEPKPVPKPVSVPVSAGTTFAEVVARGKGKQDPEQVPEQVAEPVPESVAEQDPERVAEPVPEPVPESVAKSVGTDHIHCVDVSVLTDLVEEEDTVALRKEVASLQSYIRLLEETNRGLMMKLAESQTGRS